MLSRWDLIAYSFARSLHIDLDPLMGSRSWAWFVRLLSGLLADPESMIGAYYQHQQTANNPGG